MLKLQKSKPSGLKIIVVGCGKVGATLVEQLSREGHDLTIIDINESTVSELSNSYDVLGFTGSDGQGLYGLELQYDKQLAGQAGAYITARDSTGNELPNRYSAYTAATPGMTLTTTLDTFVQAALEEQSRYLKEGTC